MTKEQKNNQIAKHTPGPWFSTFNYSDVFLIHSGGASFSIAQVPNKWRSTEQNEANARLIAAAPEMLQMLDNIRSAVGNCLTSDELQLLNNLITKATGGTL